MDISTANVAIKMVTNNDLIKKCKIMEITWKGGWQKAPSSFLPNLYRMFVSTRWLCYQPHLLGGSLLIKNTGIRETKGYLTRGYYFL